MPTSDSVDRSRRPVISVIIPTFNMARFLPQCLSTIAKQEYPNTEVIIMDGVSTDATPDVVEAYSDVVTRFVSESDEGQPDAVTKGLRMASGDIVHWHAADDIVMPGAFQRVAAEFVRDPELDLLFSDGAAFTPQRQFMMGKYSRWVNFEDAVLFFGRFQSDTAYWRKEITSQGLPLDNTKHLTCDEDFFLRLWVGHKARWIPQPLGAFRSHGDQVSQRVDRSVVEEQRADTRKNVLQMLDWSDEEASQRRRARITGYRLREMATKTWHAGRFTIRKLTLDIARRRYARWFFDDWIKPLR